MSEPAAGPVPARYLSLVESLREVRLDGTVKGVPLGAQLPLAAVPEQGWNVARGDLALPALTLDAAAVDANIETMQRFCDREGVGLAPHGKTTMSPQLFAAQLAAGAWGLTAATPTQVAVMRRHGVGRIVLANELTDAAALRWIAAELDRDPGFRFLCLVDDAGTAREMDAILAGCGARRPLTVLIEVGCSGARAGVRSTDGAVQVARAIRAAPHLTLAGVEAFEGAASAGAGADPIAAVDEMLGAVRESVLRIAQLDLFEGEEIVVTAGGSMYFDRVIGALRDWPALPRPVRLVLRSGCYVSHDNGAYERVSPFGARRAPGEQARLFNALTLWASVLSRPEPGTLIVGAGLRDAPVDRDLPRPRAWYRGGIRVGELATEAVADRVMDQHIFIRVPEDLDVRPGDVMAFDLSHPCTAFDKFRFIAMLDERHDVIDGILTSF